MDAFNRSNNQTLFEFYGDDTDRDFLHNLNVIQGSIYIPIFCAGIANNLLTILIIALNRDMRTVTNCYLLNLAISDTLPLIVSLPFEISFLPIRIPWGQLGCQLRALLAETSTNASILTISAFTIERYLAVCRPLRASSLSTTRRANKVQLGIWFAAVLSSSPYFCLMNRIDNQCFFDSEQRLFVAICFHLSATFFFVLPALILCFLYAFMAQRLYAAGLIHQVRWSRTEQMNTASMPLDSAPVNHSSHLSQHYRLSRYASIVRHAKLSSPRLPLHVQSMKKSAFKMLFAVVIAFIICYAPFHVQRLITSRLDVSNLTLRQQRALSIFYFISGILYYLGSTVNPIFYHLFSRKYRVACVRTMKRLVHFRRRLRRAPTNARPVLDIYQNGKFLQRTESIYRKPRRAKASVDLVNNKQHLFRLAMPRFAANRMR